MMRRNKFKYAIIAIALLLCSCISLKVEVNGNSYTDLTFQDAAFIHPFSIDSTDVARDQKSKLYLTEINSTEVKQCLDKYPYTWVYLWRPYCNGSNCKPLYYYEKIDRQFRDKGVKCLMISAGYYIKELKNHAERATFDREIYVIRDKDYGHNIDRAQKKFIEEIRSAAITKKQMLDNYLIYKGEKLIYMGRNISSQILDSVIHNNS